VPRFDAFVREELPLLFNLSTRQARNDIEDMLSRASLLCEPRLPDT
jgi:hypothetical protein